METTAKNIARFVAPKRAENAQKDWEFDANATYSEIIFDDGWKQHRPEAYHQYRRDWVDIPKSKVARAATNWRADRIYINEPKTLDWIAGFAKTDVLLDVGANVGMYSIWAAKTRGIRVFACEPESQNYAVLNKNIVVNSLIDEVIAYSVAISDEAKFDTLNLSSFAAGQALHGFEHAVTTRDAFAAQFEAFVPVHRQGCISTTIDDMVEAGIPFPRISKSMSTDSKTKSSPGA